MAYVTVIAMLALIEYLYFGVQVGGARGRTTRAAGGRRRRAASPWRP